MPSPGAETGSPSLGETQARVSDGLTHTLPTPKSQGLAGCRHAHSPPPLISVPKGSWQRNPKRPALW